MSDGQRSIDPPRSWGPSARSGQRGSQYGALEVVLSRQSLAGVVKTPLAELVGQLSLRVEHSFNDQYDGEFAYFETDHDTFTLVHWEPSEYVEVWASVWPENPRPSSAEFPVGTEEFRRFLDLINLPSDDIYIPHGLSPQPSPS